MKGPSYREQNGIDWRKNEEICREADISVSGKMEKIVLEY